MDHLCEPLADLEYESLGVGTKLPPRDAPALRLNGTCPAAVVAPPSVPTARSLLMPV